MEPSSAIHLFGTNTYFIPEEASPKAEETTDENELKFNQMIEFFEDPLNLDSVDQGLLLLEIAIQQNEIQSPEMIIKLLKMLNKIIGYEPTPLKYKDPTILTKSYTDSSDEIVDNVKNCISKLKEVEVKNHPAYHSKAIEEGQKKLKEAQAPADFVNLRIFVREFCQDQLKSWITNHPLSNGAYLIRKSSTLPDDNNNNYYVISCLTKVKFMNCAIRINQEGLWAEVCQKNYIIHLKNGIEYHSLQELLKAVFLNYYALPAFMPEQFVKEFQRRYIL